MVDHFQLLTQLLCRGAIAIVAIVFVILLMRSSGPVVLFGIGARRPALRAPALSEFNFTVARFAPFCWLVVLLEVSTHVVIVISEAAHAGQTTRVLDAIVIIWRVHARLIAASVLVGSVTRLLAEARLMPATPDITPFPW